jgi:hypothetical protein
MRASKGETYWDDLFDRWNVQMVVVDKAKQEKLTSEVRGSAVWEVVYEDELGIVAVRKHSLNFGDDSAATKKKAEEQ